MSSTTLCNPSQLSQHKHSQTSSGIALENVVLDRESGKPIVIQYPSFDLVMSGSSLSFRTDWQGLSPSNLMLLLKCLVIIQSLPETALQETVEELEGISCFYSNRSPQVNLPMISTNSIKGKLRAAQVRPPIVLES